MMLMMTCSRCNGRLEFGPGKLLECTECGEPIDILDDQSNKRAGMLTVNLPRMAMIVWIEGSLPRKEPAWTHLIIWPDAGVVVPWPEDLTGEEAFTAWAERRALYGPRSEATWHPRDRALINIDTNVERADANEVYLIHWEEIGIVIPWPEGHTVKEAMDVWIAAHRY